MNRIAIATALSLLAAGPAWATNGMRMTGFGPVQNSMGGVGVGYNYGKMPLDAARAFENIVFPAIAEHHFMGGVGLRVTGELGINLGFMIAPTATLSGENGAPPPAMGGAGQGIVSYETRMSQWAVDAGLAYRF